MNSPSSSSSSYPIPFDWHARRCADVVHAGGVIAYPTEGVWGLGCDPWSESAVRRLLLLKKRSEAKGVILISGEAEHFWPLLKNLPDTLVDKVLTRSVRATTWIVPDPHDFVPAFLKGRHESIAIRISTHPEVKRLSRYWRAPLVSTSANLSGHPAALSSLRVRQYFRDSLDAILPGHTSEDRRPSQIIELLSGKIVRA